MITENTALRINRLETDYIFSQTNNVVITNTTTETSMLGNIIGTKTIKANTLNIGDVLYCKILGTITTPTQGANPTLKIKLGASTIYLGATTITQEVTNGNFNIEFYIKIISATSCAVLGSREYQSGANYSNLNISPIQTINASINTSVDNIIDVTYQWATASTTRSITGIIANLQKMRGYE